VVANEDAGFPIEAGVSWLANPEDGDLRSFPTTEEEPVPITLIVTLVAKPESISEIAGVLEEVKSYLPKVEGCESVRICRAIDDPAAFTLIEEWTSREAHEAYQRGVAEAGGWDHFTRHLASDAVSVYFEDF
jgi:quinol monooxygenase YgiN